MTKAPKAISAHEALERLAVDFANVYSRYWAGFRDVNDEPIVQQVKHILGRLGDVVTDQGWKQKPRARTYR